jgi:RNA polymerase sigma-70 factor, ECF subfamily
VTDASATDVSVLMKTTAKAAADGIPGAIERFLSAVHAFAVRYCRAVMGRQAQSYDAADRTARQICRDVRVALPAYSLNGGPVLEFVYGIAARRTATMFRPGITVTKLLNDLPKPQREIIVLRVAVGFSAEDTAEAVGSTPGAVRLTQHHALERMRHRLSPGR